MLAEKSSGAPPAALPESTGDRAIVFGQNALFTDLSPEVLETISRRIEAVTLTPDQILFQENDPGDCLYLIAEGSIKISKRGRGGQQETLAYLPANDYFGEMALVDGGKRSAQASAPARSNHLTSIARHLTGAA